MEIHEHISSDQRSYWIAFTHLDHSIVIHKRPDHRSNTTPLTIFQKQKEQTNLTQFKTPQLTERTFLFKFAYGATCIILVLIECSGTPLAFPRPSPVNSATFMMPSVTIMENQRCIISLVTVIFSGYTDARTSLHGCKKSTCHTIDEPHGYPIKLSTPGWWAMAGWGPDPWLNRTWTRIEEARAIRGAGSCSHELKGPGCGSLRKRGEKKKPRA